MLQEWKRRLGEKAKPEKIEDLKRFFKTGPGDYAEGDKFIGVSVPDNRAVSKKFANSDFDVIDKMLDSPIHEYRLAGLLALVERYKKAKNTDDRHKIAKYYIYVCHKANNWDLVDLSAEYILGYEILAGRCFDDVYVLSNSNNLWEQRVAIVATLTPIRKGELDLAFELCDRHIEHSHPLIRKAVGWILRECGKKDRLRLKTFLKEHIKKISAITLSYATEHFPLEEKKDFQILRKQQLKKQIKTAS